MAVTPKTQSEIKKPVFKVIDVKDLVERLDPKRHEPDTEYEFTNGRKFKRRL